jgi:hypothetical protein
VSWRERILKQIIADILRIKAMLRNMQQGNIQHVMNCNKKGLE